MNAQESIRAFVTGEMDIEDFAARFEADDAIRAWLDGVIDRMIRESLPAKRRTMTRQGPNGEETFPLRSYAEDYVPALCQSSLELAPAWKAAPPKVGDQLALEIRRGMHRTGYGAARLHGTVADVYAQADDTVLRTERYQQAHDFALACYPGAVYGSPEAETYIRRHILPKYPDTMKKGARTKAIKAAISDAFPREEGKWPHWRALSEWPCDANGEPMAFCQQKKSADGWMEYCFRPADGGGMRIIRQ